MRRAAFLLAKTLLWIDIAVALAAAGALFASRAFAYATGRNIFGEGPWFLRILILAVATFLGAPILMIPYLMAKDALAKGREASG